MAIFTGDEIFRISIELEKKGEQFYEVLAEKAGNQKVADLCKDLAAQEQQHARLFEDLRVKTTRRAASRPLSWDELHFAQMLVEERVLPDPDEARDVVEKEGVAAALTMAIQFEKDSVLFYQELLPAVDEQDRQAVSAIVEQEKQHAEQLTKVKRALAS
jgi:rubrerythrin